MALTVLIDKAGEYGSFLRKAVRVLSQALMDIEVSQISARSSMSPHQTARASAMAASIHYRTRAWEAGSMAVRGAR